MCDASSDVTPSKCYKFKSGEEVSTTGPFGKGLKVYKLYRKCLCLTFSI